MNVIGARHRPFNARKACPVGVNARFQGFRLRLQVVRLIMADDHLLLDLFWIIRGNGKKLLLRRLDQLVIRRYRCAILTHRKLGRITLLLQSRHFIAQGFQMTLRFFKPSERKPFPQMTHAVMGKLGFLQKFAKRFARLFTLTAGLFRLLAGGGVFLARLHKRRGVFLELGEATLFRSQLLF